MSAEHRSCGIGAFLPMSCRGRAEAFARRLQTRLHHLGGTSESEETEESWLTSQHCSHPTLHQPRHSTSSESDIYYDFDLDSPGSPQEEATEAELKHILLNGQDKSDVESGCVSAVTATSPGSDSSDGNYYDPESFDFPCPEVRKLNGHREGGEESCAEPTITSTTLSCGETRRTRRDFNGKASKMKQETESIAEDAGISPERTEEEKSEESMTEDDSDNERMNRERQKKTSDESGETYCSTFVLLSERVIECAPEAASTEVSRVTIDTCNGSKEDVVALDACETDEECPVDLDICNASNEECPADIDTCNESKEDVVALDACETDKKCPADIDTCKVEGGNEESVTVVVDACEADPAVSTVSNVPEQTNKLTVRKKCSVTVDKSDDDEEEERPQRVQRCSSLKTGKTPPGTPGRKKIVRFADVLGLDLADVRTFLDEIPKVPTSAYEDLHNADLSVGNNSISSLPRPDRALMPLFQQPGGAPDFLDKVRRQYVCLENAMVKDISTCAIAGTVRVVNLDFHKSVHIRYSLDNWRSFCDLQASYVENSCDGFSDKFTFIMYAHTLVVGQRLEFAVRFQCHGVQYWDSNNGINYIFQCLPPSNPPPFLSLASPEGDRWASFY